MPTSTASSGAAYPVHDSSRGCVQTRKDVERNQKFGKDTKLREILGALSEYKFTITLYLSSVHAQQAQLPHITSEAPKSYFDIPSSRLSHFVGRSEIFDRIQETINATSIHPPVVVLTGVGGQGKTQTVLEFCHRNENCYRGIFWINSISEASAVRSYERIIKNLGFEIPSGDGQDSKSTLKSILCSWKDPWLLVFDNYDSPDSFQNVASFFPGSDGTAKSAILVTSRRPSSARLGSGIPLNGLSEEEGLALLYSRTHTTSGGFTNCEEGVGWQNNCETTWFSSPCH
jgi:hypothetical protein